MLIKTHLNNALLSLSDFVCFNHEHEQELVIAETLTSFVLLKLSTADWSGPGQSSPPGGDDQVHDSPGDQQCEDRGRARRAGHQGNYHKRKESR